MQYCTLYNTYKPRKVKDFIQDNKTIYTPRISKRIYKNYEFATNKKNIRGCINSPKVRIKSKVEIPES